MHSKEACDIPAWLKREYEYYLRTRGERDGFTFVCPEHFVLTYGREFTPKQCPTGIARGKQKKCFQNAFDLADERPETLTYVEGYAATAHSFSPVYHAWCADEEGNAIDTTWEPEGIAYFGVPFRLDYTIVVGYETSLPNIDNWKSDFALLKGVPEDQWLADF